MRARWHAIHAQLLRALDKHTTHTGFQETRRRHACLEPFPDPAALLDHQHDQRRGCAAQNAVLAALVCEAQGKTTTSDVALLLVVLALWPGLDAIYRRRLRHFRDEPDVLASEIHVRVTGQIRGLDLDRVTRIAATILRNIDRDIGRTLQAEWQRSRLTVPIDGDTATRMTVERGDQSSIAGSASDHSDAIAALAMLPEPDAALVVDVAVIGRTQREAAERHALSHAAARKRYRRSLARLRRELVA